MMLLSDTIVDFHLFYDGAVDIQIWVLLTRSQCKVFDTQVTVKACGSLVHPVLGDLIVCCGFIIICCGFIIIWCVGYIIICCRFIIICCGFIIICCQNQIRISFLEITFVKMAAKWKIQSLKRSTFPFLRSLTVRSPSVQRAFIVRSSFAHRAFS